MRLLFGIAFLLSFLTVEARAEAPRRIALNWVRAQGAETCIDPRALAVRVEALVGPVLVALAEAEVSIEGEIAQRSADNYRIRLTVTDRQGEIRGERLLEPRARTCRELDGMIAFVVAIMVDPDVTLPEELSALFATEQPPEESLLRELESEPPRATAPSEPVSVPQVSPQPEPPAQVDGAAHPPPLQRRTVVGAGVGPAFSILPRTALALELGYGRRLGEVFLVRAGVRGVPSLGDERVDHQRSIAVQSYDLALHGCFAQPFERRLSLAGCAGPELNLWFTQGNGFDKPAKARLVGSALSLAPVLWLRLKNGLGLQLTALLRVNMVRRRFTYTDPQGRENTAFTVPRLSAALFLGPSYAF